MRMTCRWNATSTVTSKYYPGKAEAMSEGAKSYGAVAITIICLAALYALLLSYQLASEGTALQLRIVPGEGRAVSSITMIAGAAVLLCSLALYTGLAFGAHKEIKDKFAGSDVDAELWPHPSWAFVGAFLSGACMLAASWRLQGEGEGWGLCDIPSAAWYGHSSVHGQICFPPCNL